MQNSFHKTARKLQTTQTFPTPEPTPTLTNNSSKKESQDQKMREWRRGSCKKGAPTFSVKEPAKMCP
ncbi:hypothetical protein JTE90_008406 [Oedothorax gibbosus]|uniref:Uncharacterized protein n=1 Tax=Oedothorax gibbosus TaxID=931172 RepID=A0AAV6V580_9ARAC|nr:hypothetical protein JTE90_008406 [Oedothorax gibbosus]